MNRIQSIYVCTIHMLGEFKGKRIKPGVQFFESLFKTTIIIELTMENCKLTQLCYVYSIKIFMVCSQPRIFRSKNDHHLLQILPTMSHEHACKCGQKHPGTQRNRSSIHLIENDNTLSRKNHSYITFILTMMETIEHALSSPAKLAKLFESSRSYEDDKIIKRKFCND